MDTPKCELGGDWLCSDIDDEWEGYCLPCQARVAIEQSTKQKERAK